MAHVLKVNGDVIAIDVPPSGLSAQQLHELVGGTIEIVSLERPSRRYAALVVNDNGRALGLPVNDVATMLYRASLAHPRLDDVIVGDAVVVRVIDPGRDSERIV